LSDDRKNVRGVAGGVVAGVAVPAAFKANNDGFTGRLQITRSW
jgi:hypothetical protein